MNDDAIIIQPAGEADFRTVVAFNQAMAKESEDKTLDESVIAAGVHAALRDETGCKYFIARIGGEIAGQTMLTFEWSDWRNGFFWWIQSVYVDPRFRRRGVFRAIHRHIRDMATSRSDVCGLRLYVDRSNAGAIEAYGKLGMTMTDYLLFEEEWPAPSTSDKS